ncbi:MAG TPA: calcium-binding protein, partial [Acetobacteraceae bacterium]|nr:calcium-binding protein [Acetobacteraceae bacterium]
MTTLNGSDASEAITGGAESDTLIGGGGNDTLDGGGGWNVAAYWTSGGPVGVQLFRGLTSMDGFGGQDTLVNIHGVFGSAFDDVFLG